MFYVNEVHVYAYKSYNLLIMGRGNKTTFNKFCKKPPTPVNFISGTLCHNKVAVTIVGIAPQYQTIKLI